MPEPAPKPQLAYCTNVHAGASWGQTRANLERHALAVKRIVSPDQPLGVGLWLSARSAREVIEGQRIEELRDFLHTSGLDVFTFNGFPHGDFHQPVVKKAVYTPNWTDPARADYTRDLIAILARLIPEGAEGSISTLPIAWGNSTHVARAQTTGAQLSSPASEISNLKSVISNLKSQISNLKSEISILNSQIPTPPLTAAAKNLTSLARELHVLEQETGRLIHLDLEPEPGCILDTSADVVRFFEDHLLRQVKTEEESLIRRHLRVCHDICHAAVMFEDQDDALRTYESAGIEVGKVQISSALRIDFDALEDDAHKQKALEALRSFAEDRYLHQTCVRSSPEAQPVFHEDLSDALDALKNTAAPPTGEWRTHFHIPIHIETLDPLATTQPEIAACLNSIHRRHPHARHFEIETYAWPVLPPEHRAADLAEGVAREWIWLQRQFDAFR
ncbi:MAG: hypothetical protein EA376_03705 [Phycisphaeraceae bacterium]|nr:MAG: hypothetical protein EA376_03705 [Phycisphaeraceae bacterium]